jgi:hypothetical protein
VDLYKKYERRVHFVVIDIDKKLSSNQQDLVKKYYQGYIPHVVVLDSAGKALYNSSGEVEEPALSAILDKTLQ